MNFPKTDLNPTVQEFRKQWYLDLYEPLDGMWEALYIGGADIFLIQEDGLDLGYACIDAQKTLNQIFLQESHRYLMKGVIGELISSGLATSAQLGINDMVSFNACLSLSRSMEENTFNYRFSNHQKQILHHEPVSLRLVKAEDIDEVKSFLKTEAGFDDTFGYTENLCNRNEMYLVEGGEGIMATGECRLSDTQPKYADVGMIVRGSYRKRGLGTRILTELNEIACSKGRIPICSTTIENIASQKAIERAGFYHTHTIFNIHF